MKRIALLVFLAAWLVPGAFAQENEHVQAGVYADYFHLAETNTNLAGVGGRVSFVAYKRMKFEAEMNYDFAQAFTEGFTDTGTGTVTVQRTNLRVLHGLFGPKINLGVHNVQPFVTLKGGFADFMLDARPVTAGTIVSSIEGLRSQNLNGVLYPGGGIQGHLGPVGLRLDVGDEIYFNNGAHHNLRVAFGPFLRF